MTLSTYPLSSRPHWTEGRAPGGRRVFSLTVRSSFTIVLDFDQWD
jgi:hypothetical protein